MIPNIGELAVLMSRWDANQQRKNKWKQSRYEALDYYNANTKEYVADYFNESMLKKIVTGNVKTVSYTHLTLPTPPYV